MCQDSARAMEWHVQVVKRQAISRRCAKARDQAVHELEVKGAKEVDEGKIETVSVDSVHLNKNQSLITVNLEMQAVKKVIEIQYKINTGSEGNIMPLYIFKKLFKNMTQDQLKNP